MARALPSLPPRPSSPRPSSALAFPPPSFPLALSLSRSHFFSRVLAPSFIFAPSLKRSGPCALACITWRVKGQDGDTMRRRARKERAAKKGRNKNAGTTVVPSASPYHVCVCACSSRFAVARAV